MRYLLILLFFLSSHLDYVCAESFNRTTGEESKQADAFQRGLTALKENRFEDAFEELSAAERERPDDARVRNFRGIVLAQMGRNAEATAEYQESIRLDPLLEDAYRNLGFLRWTEHQLVPARDALQRAVELSPDDFFAHYYLGRVELDAEQYERAFHELDISRQPLPANAAFLIQATAGYLALGRKQDAAQFLDQLRKLRLSDAESIQLAPLLLAVHENEWAIGLIKKLISANSTRASWAQFDLALVYLLAGNDEKALVQAHTYWGSLPQGSEKSTEYAEGWSLLGIACARLNQGERSINAFRQASSLAPGEEEYWLNLTRELMELNRYPEAITAARNGLGALPKSYALHLRLGAAYLAAGRYTEAESVFRDLVMAGDPLPTGYVGLAQVLLRTDRAAEAATELSDAERRIGPTFLLSYFRGLALDREGKRPEALGAFQAAVRLNPNSAEAHLHLGKTEFVMGQPHPAIAELQETLRLDPGNNQAKRLLSQAYRRVGDEKKAAQFAEASAEATAASPDDLIGDFFVPQWQIPPSGAGK